MHSFKIFSTLTVSLLVVACTQPEKPANTAAIKASPPPAPIAIDENRLLAGTRFAAATMPLSREDAASLAGADSVVYKADTLATTEAHELVLIGRMYSNETIGWLTTVSRASGQLLDKQVVYYNNAEGMSQTDANWFPNRQHVLVRTKSYDEEGREQTTRVEYTVRADGKLKTISNN